MKRIPSVPLVFVGVATFDTIALVDHAPGIDDRILAEQLLHAGGGPAATAAVAAARLGHAVAFIGAVGNDDNGRTIERQLVAEGVDTSGMTVAEHAPSAASIVVVDRAQGTRSIINRPPPPLVLSTPALELLRAADWIHVDQAGWPTIHQWRQSETSNARLSVDGGNPIEDFSPEEVDLYVPTVNALRQRYGCLEPEALIDCALGEGARMVVATDGARGALAKGQQQALVTVPAATGTVLSTLGAGDVFHGALLAALVRNQSLDACLRYANEVALTSCQGLDGRSTIPDHVTTLAALERDEQEHP